MKTTDLPKQAKQENNKMKILLPLFTLALLAPSAWSLGQVSADITAKANIHKNAWLFSALNLLCVLQLNRLVRLACVLTVDAVVQTLALSRSCLLQKKT